MISNPRIGQRVQIWYAAKWRQTCPHHGSIGTVSIASKGKPKNHAVELDTGELVVVPCGNLRQPVDMIQCFNNQDGL